MASFSSCPTAGISSKSHCKRREQFLAIKSIILAKNQIWNINVESSYWEKSAPKLNLVANRNKQANNKNASLKLSCSLKNILKKNINTLFYRNQESELIWEALQEKKDETFSQKI